MVALVNGFVRKQLPSSRDKRSYSPQVVAPHALRQLEGFAVREADDVAAW